MYSLSTYPKRRGSKDKEQGDIDGLQNYAYAVDGGDEVGAGLGDPIVDPQGGAEEGDDVRRRLEPLRRPPPHYPPEGFSTEVLCE